MAEQKHEQRKSRLIRRILRWLGIGLLAIFLILALIYQAPWKVITLLAVLLAGCTVLPRAARKWFWLSVGAGVLVLIVWLLVPMDSEGWRPYAFDAESAALEARYTVPDEENAALLYDEIFKTLDTDTNAPEFYMQSVPSSTNEPWLSKDHPEMAEWLKDRQGTIAKLLQVAGKDKCHFPIPSDSWDFGRHVERFGPMRKSAFLLISAANNDIAEGRIDGGLEKYLCIIRMADHLHQQPVAIDFLVASALESLAFTQLNRFVIEGRPTVEQLQLISNSAKDLNNNWGSEFKKMLECDKLLNKNNFCSLVYEVNSQGKIRFNRDPLAAMFKAAPPQEVPRLTFWHRKLWKAWTIANWFIMPSTPQEAAEILDAGYDTMTEPGFDWTKRPQSLDSLITRSNFRRIKLNFRYLARFMADIPEGTYFLLHDAYLRNLATRRGSRVLMGIGQYRSEHGVWPPDLDAISSNVPAEALIDPLNNGPFVYRLTDDAFMLYSKGKNGIDGEGRWDYILDPDFGLPTPVEDDLPFWPPRSRISQMKYDDTDPNQPGEDARGAE